LLLVAPSVETLELVETLSYQDLVCTDTGFTYDSYLQEDFFSDDTKMPSIETEAGQVTPEDKKN
jgi:hypothetical protein